MAASNKQQGTIEEIDKYLEGKYGDMGDPLINARRPNIFYRFGIAPMDYALGGGDGTVGGFPSGHMTEVYGKEAVGKTTLVYRAIAQAQRDHPDKVHLILDYECTTDPKYIQACGVILDKKQLRIFRPESLEEGFRIMLLFHKSGKLGICCVDSLAAMSPEADIKKLKENLSSAMVASKARLLHQILRLMVPELEGSDSAVIFINHEIANIHSGFVPTGAPATTTSGGGALKYYAVMRIQLTFGGMLTEERKTLDGKEQKMGIGRRIRLYVEKFKVGSPGQRVNYIIRAGEGIDILTPLIATGVAQGVLVKAKGGMYTVNLPAYADFKIRGEDAFREHLRGDAAMQQAFLEAVGETWDTDATTDNLSVFSDEIEVE